MIITKEQLKELNKSGETEIRYFEANKEFWELIRVFEVIK